MTRRPTDSDGAAGSAGERAVTSVLGVIMLVAVVLISIAAFTAFGGDAVDDTTRNVDVKAAEGEINELARAADSVALGETPQVTVDLNLNRGGSEGTTTVRPADGRLTVDITNPDAGDLTETYELGSVRYENDGAIVAYQAGGVWRDYSRSGVVMIREPALQYSSERGRPSLTLPVVLVRGPDGRSETVLTGATISERSIERPYGPVWIPPEGDVTVTVESRFAPGWKRWIETSVGESEPVSTARLDDGRIEIVFGDDDSTGMYLHFSKRTIAVGSGGTG